jgi:hypothetical protein
MAKEGLPAWKEALNGDPLDWLLEEDNPPARYLTLTQLLGRPLHDAEVVRAGRAVFDYPPAQRLLELLDDAPRDLDSLSRFGLPGDHPAIAKACEKWLEADFPPRPSCYPEQTIGGLIRYADLDDSRLQDKIGFVLRNQPFADGNRPGTSLRYGKRGACCGSHSCFSAVARALWALTGVPEEKRTAEIQAFLQKGARFLAAHRLYQRNHHGFKPVLRAWLRLHLPFALGWRTDVMDLLDIATQIGLHDDPSIVDALRFLLAKQNERGRWPLEETFGRHYEGLLGTAVKDIESVGQESKWITLSALVQLKRCEKLVLALTRGEEPARAAEASSQPRFADYPFPYDPDEEARVRREWRELGMAELLDDLLGFARSNQLQVGWRWGLVLGPDDCPEWCSASVRYVPSKTMKNAWVVGRICFLAQKGQFAAERLSARLGIPLRDEAPGKKAAWIEATLWRIGVEEWKSGCEEIGLALRDPKEFARVREVMREALGAFRGD